MRVVVQKAVIKVITPQVVHYMCDFCGVRCGTRENPKQTRYKTGQGAGSSRSYHYLQEDGLS